MSMNKGQINMHDNVGSLNIQVFYWKCKLLHNEMEEFVKCDKKPKTGAQMRCRIKIIWRILHEVAFLWYLSASEEQADRLYISVWNLENGIQLLHNSTMSRILPSFSSKVRLPPHPPEWCLNISSSLSCWCSYFRKL